MTDRFEDDADPQADERDPERTPTIRCDRCGREWDLGYELDDMGVGNQAVEQFALDHKRHTGHFPDDIALWIASCRRCPDREEFLSAGPASRWAETHARHTRHRVDLRHGSTVERTIYDPDAE